MPSTHHYRPRLELLEDRLTPATTASQVAPVFHPSKVAPAVVAVVEQLITLPLHLSNSPLIATAAAPAAYSLVQI